jgi:hypothetical protein
MANPQGVALDGSGNVYVTNNHIVSKINPDATSSVIAGTIGSPGFSDDTTGAGTALFNLPSGIAIDTYGNIFVADTGNNRIRVIDTYGYVLTLAGSGVSGVVGSTPLKMPLANPIGIAFDASNNLCMVLSDSVQRLSLSYSSLLRDISTMKSAMVVAATTTRWPTATIITTSRA